MIIAPSRWLRELLRIYQDLISNLRSGLVELSKLLGVGKSRPCWLKCAPRYVQMFHLDK